MEDNDHDLLINQNKQGFGVLSKKLNFFCLIRCSKYVFIIVL